MPRGPVWEVEHDRALLDAVDDPTRGWDWLAAGNRPAEIADRTIDSLRKRVVRMTQAQEDAARALKLPSATRIPDNKTYNPAAAPAPAPVPRQRSSSMMPPPPPPQPFSMPAPKPSRRTKTPLLTPAPLPTGQSSFAMTPDQLRRASMAAANAAIPNPRAQSQSTRPRRSDRRWRLGLSQQAQQPSTSSPAYVSQVPGQSMFASTPAQPTPARLGPSSGQVFPAHLPTEPRYPRRSSRLQSQPPQYAAPAPPEEEKEDKSDDVPRRPFMRPHTYSRRQIGIQNMEDLVNQPVDTVLRRQYPEDLPNLSTISRGNLASDLELMGVPDPRRGPSSTLAGDRMLNTPSLLVANRDDRWDEPIYANDRGDVRTTGYLGVETKRRRAARMLREFPPGDDEDEEEE